MLLPVLTTLSHRSSHRRRLMRNHSHLYTSNSRHLSLTVSPTRTTALTLVVFLLRLRLHQLDSAAHQLRPLARVLRPHTVSALPAHLRRCDRSLRTEQDLRATDTRDHTSTMLILLPLVALLAELLRQLLPRRLLSRQLASATTDRRLLHQSDTASGRKMTMRTQSLR
jgi:hypothetical protein